jgi:hypothetical protein
MGGTDVRGHTNLLRGTMAPILGVAKIGVKFTDTVGNDTITVGAGADNTFKGGNDSVRLDNAGTSAAANSTVLIGRFDVGHSGTQAVPPPGLTPILAFCTSRLSCRKAAIALIAMPNGDSSGESRVR